MKKVLVDKTSEEIVKLLLSEEGGNILAQKGKINFNFANVRFGIKNNNIVGDVLQEWFGKYLTKNNIRHSPNSNTQAFPDFIVKSDADNTEGYCELKSFNAINAPAFDVANYYSYVEEVSKNVAILDAKYIIFAYKLEESILTISNVYCKNIWEITGETQNESLKCQIKIGKVYNIRPVHFAGTKNVKCKPFKSLGEFLIALYKFKVEQALGSDVASHQLWIKSIAQSYTELHGDDTVEKEVILYLDKNIKYKRGEKMGEK